MNWYNFSQGLPPIGKVVKIALFTELPAIRIQGENDDEVKWEAPEITSVPSRVAGWKNIESDEEVEQCKAALHEVHMRNKLNGTPCMMIGQEELDNAPEAEDTYNCTCGDTHVVTVQKSEEGEVTLGFYTCGVQTFLYSLNGKRVAK
jgi:hypothetical protein